MIRRLKSLQIITFITLGLIVFSPAGGQTATRLFGNIYYNTVWPVNAKFVPYRDFKIELLEVPEENNPKVKPHKVLFTTYPDSNGYFTFKDVKENRYILRISLVSIEEGKFIDEVIISRNITVKYNESGKQRLTPIQID